MKEKLSAKLAELSPLLENTHENSFLFYTRLCQTPQRGCCSPQGCLPFPWLPGFPPFPAGSRQCWRQESSWLPGQLATARGSSCCSGSCRAFGSQAGRAEGAALRAGSPALQAACGPDAAWVCAAVITIINNNNMPANHDDSRH